VVEGTSFSSTSPARGLIVEINNKYYIVPRRYNVIIIIFIVIRDILCYAIYDVLYYYARDTTHRSPRLRICPSGVPIIADDRILPWIYADLFCRYRVPAEPVERSTNYNRGSRESAVSPYYPKILCYVLFIGAVYNYY